MSKKKKKEKDRICKTSISRKLTNCNSQIKLTSHSPSPLLFPIFRTKQQLTTKFPIREGDDVIDAVFNSRGVLVGGCFRGIVTGRELPRDRQRIQILFL
jgi:hypothetical protein